MSGGFTDELLQRIFDARQALVRAQLAADGYSARVYSGELDSLYRLARENDVPVPPEPDVDRPNDG